MIWSWSSETAAEAILPSFQLRFVLSVHLCRSLRVVLIEWSSRSVEMNKIVHLIPRSICSLLEQAKKKAMNTIVFMSILTAHLAKYLDNYIIVPSLTVMLYLLIWGNVGDTKYEFGQKKEVRMSSVRAWKFQKTILWPLKTSSYAPIRKMRL